jgi:hypothetical protein
VVVRTLRLVVKQALLRAVITKADDAAAAAAALRPAGRARRRLRVCDALEQPQLIKQLLLHSLASLLSGVRMHARTQQRGRRGHQQAV